MSLFSCPSCGNDVSSAASSCPKCGHPFFPCPYCTKSTPKGAGCCSWCGNSLTGQTKRKPVKPIDGKTVLGWGLVIALVLLEERQAFPTFRINSCRHRQLGAAGASKPPKVQRRAAAGRAAGHGTSAAGLQSFRGRAAPCGGDEDVHHRPQLPACLCPGHRQF